MNGPRNKLPPAPVCPEQATAEKNSESKREVRIYSHLHYKQFRTFFQQKAKIVPQFLFGPFWTGHCNQLSPSFLCILYGPAQILQQSAHNYILWIKRCPGNRR